MERDSAYFARRAQEEREAALKSPHAGAREAHLALAEQYEAVANGERPVLEPVTPISR